MTNELVGKMVKGPSGRHLGRIDHASASRFCVDIGGKQVWLPNDVIFSSDDDHVTVIFEPSSVDRYALPARRRQHRAG